MQREQSQLHKSLKSNQPWGVFAVVGKNPQVQQYII